MVRIKNLASTETKLLSKNRIVSFIQFEISSNTLIFNYFKSIELCEESRFEYHKEAEGQSWLRKSYRLPGYNELPFNAKKSHNSCRATLSNPNLVRKLCAPR